MKVLVTGAAGFIGQHLTTELARAGHDVVPFDIVYGGDCLSPTSVISALDSHKPDVLVHLAAKVGRVLGEDDPRQTVAANAAATVNVAKLAAARRVRLVYASTSEVYGDQGDAVCREDGPLALPHNLYGLSKRWGEEACRLYAPRHLTVWRISMPYGPGLPAGRGRAAIINMLHQALHRQPIPVHRGAERSWCWIGDTVRAMRLTIERADGGVFNIGRDDNPRTMRDVAGIACDLTGAPRALIREVEPPARQTVVKRLATDRIRSLGWEPHVALEDGMARTLTAVRELPAAA